MITSIHQSTLNMFLRCGEQGRRRYIENEIIPPGVAAGRGIGVHKANEVNLKQKIRTGQDMPLSDLNDATRDGFVNAFRNGIYLPKEKISEKAKVLNDGLIDALRCTKIYREEVAGLINPIAIEEPFNIDVGLDLPLAGRMDYQEKPIVGDLKTTSVKWQTDRIKKEIQVPFYSLVHLKTHGAGTTPKFRYDVLIARRNKEGEPTSEEYQPLEHTCSTEDYQALFYKLELFIKMLKKGVFMPANPTSWWCNPDWCGYWHTCRYVGNGISKKWI
jgi:hypothetical protein